MANSIPFQALSPTHAIAATNTASAPEQILPTAGSSAQFQNYLVLNDTTGKVALTLSSNKTLLAAFPTPGSPLPFTYVIEGGSQVTLTSSNEAWVSVIAQSPNAGTLYIVGGEGFTGGNGGSTNVPGTITVANTQQVFESLSATNYDLSAAAYNQSTAVTGDFLLDHIELKFSTAASRTITVSSVATGTVFYNKTLTNLSVLLSSDDEYFKNGDQVNITVTQTSSACLMSLRLFTVLGATFLPPATTTVNQGNAGNQAWPVQIGTAGANSVTNPVFISNGMVKDTNNSTTTLLNASQVFTGGWTDVSSYGAITYNLFANPDTMTTSPTLTFEFSTDAVNADVFVPATVNNGNIFIPVPLRPVMQYFRLVYTNGSTNQSAFRLTTYLHRAAPDQLVRTGIQTLQPLDPTVVVRALIEPSFKGHLSILGADRSIGGEAIVLPYIIQDKWEFDEAFTNNNIATAVSGSGTATQTAANGVVLALPDASGTAIAQLQGQKRLRYKPGREFRMEFSTGFQATGTAGANQLYGLTDAIIPAPNYDGPSVTYTGTTLTDTNASFSAATGVTVGQTITAGAAGASTATITAVTSTTVLTFSGGWTGGTPANFTPYTVNPKTIDPTTTGNALLLGWVGTTFGFHIVSGGTITSFAQGNWASVAGRQLVGGGELLDGSGLSAFRQNNAPIAWLLNKGNAYRIRGVWFGVGPVYLDIKSPDDVWVPAFFFRYPNTATVPYIQNPNMFMFAGVQKTSVATTGYQMFSFCADAGTVEAEKAFESHEINGRKLIQRAGAGLTSTTQLFHTVASGRQLLVNSFFTSIVFNSASSHLEIRDGGASGALRFALQGGQANSLTSEGPAFPTPLQFFTDVTIVIVGGAATWSGGMSGYERDL